jgi:hypothetical protein
MTEQVAQLVDTVKFTTFASVVYGKYKETDLEEDPFNPAGRGSLTCQNRMYRITNQLERITSPLLQNFLRFIFYVEIGNL